MNIIVWNTVSSHKILKVQVYYHMVYRVHTYMHMPLIIITTKNVCIISKVCICIAMKITSHLCKLLCAS